MVVKVN